MEINKAKKNMSYAQKIDMTKAYDRLDCYHGETDVMYGFHCWCMSFGYIQGISRCVLVIAQNDSMKHKKKKKIPA